MVNQRVGILALQGDFQAHRDKLSELGADTLLIRKASEFKAISGLILPGGESSAMLKLMDAEFRSAFSRFLSNRPAIFATCAGTILLAKQVSNPEQFSFEALDVDVRRNGYGRQIDSFITPSIEFTEQGSTLFGGLSAEPALEGVFIRAPVITRTGSQVTVLARANGTPVLIQQGNILAATFHPELGEHSSLLHRYYLKLVEVSCCAA